MGSGTSRWAGIPPSEGVRVLQSGLRLTLNIPASLWRTTDLHKDFLPPYQAMGECFSWGCKKVTYAPSHVPWYLPKEA